jgi:hypothetical protein
MSARSAHNAPPTSLPADASIYLFTYAKSATPLPDRLAEVAARATTRFGAAPAALIVPASELGDYMAAQEGREETFHLLPSLHLTIGHVGAIQRD